MSTPLRQQAMLLVRIGGNVGFGGDDRVAFIDDQIVVASVMPQTHELQLFIGDLGEFVARETEHLRREIGADEFDELIADGA